MSPTTHDTIRCPRCNAFYEDEGYRPVTYWAEDGPQEVECEHCGCAYYVDERVNRTYGVGRTKEEADAN